MSTNIFLVKPRMGSAKNPPYWDPAIRRLNLDLDFIFEITRDINKE